MQDPRFYSLVLHRLPHVGAVTYNRLVSLFGSPEAALNQPDKQLESLLELETLSVIQDFQSNPQMSPIGVRRDKAALSPWVKIPLGYRSSRKQPEQLWRQRNS